MSKYVNDLIASIKQEPEEWRHESINGSHYGITNDDISITNCGNVMFYWGMDWYQPTIITVTTLKDDQQHPLGSYTDKMNLERAVKWWFETQPLEAILR